MLTILMHLLQESPDRVDLEQIGRRLGSQPTAVAGMIDTLVKMGRLEEIKLECGPCAACDKAKDCALSTLPVRRLRCIRE